MIDILLSSSSFHFNALSNDCFNLGCKIIFSRVKGSHFSIRRFWNLSGCYLDLLIVSNWVGINLYSSAAQFFQ